MSQIYFILFLYFFTLSTSLVKILIAPSMKDGPEEWKIENAKKLASECPLPCMITDRLAESDCVVSHCKGTKTQASLGAAEKKLRAFYCTEDDEEYRTALEEADFLITHDLLENSQVVPLTHLKNISKFFKDAQSNFAERKTISELALVSHQLDPIKEEMVQEISKFYPVFAYDTVLKNVKWPIGHENDKIFVLKQHKFCLALEKSDRGANTDQLWDCLRAATVPVYYGNLDMIDHTSIPRNSVVKLKKFPTYKALADHLWEMSKNNTLYEQYRYWIHDSPQDFYDFHRIRSPSTQVCRLCIKIATNPMYMSPYL